MHCTLGRARGLSVRRYSSTTLHICSTCSPQNILPAACGPFPFHMSYVILQFCFSVKKWERLCWQDSEILSTDISIVNCRIPGRACRFALNFTAIILEEHLISHLVQQTRHHSGIYASTWTTGTSTNLGEKSKLYCTHPMAKCLVLFSKVPKTPREVPVDHFYP